MGQIPFRDNLDIFGVDSAVFPFGYFLFKSDSSVDRSSLKKAILVVEEYVGLGCADLTVDLGRARWPLPLRNSRINQAQPKGRRKPPWLGLSGRAGSGLIYPPAIIFGTSRGVPRRKPCDIGQSC